MNYQQKQKKLIQEIIQKIKDNKSPGSTIVEIRKDYENDDALTLTSVVFLNEELAQKIQKQIIEPLKKIDPQHYYYLPGSLHLTIKNIRTINKPPLFNAEDIEKVKTVFNQIVPSFKSFDFELKGLVHFPTSLSLIGYCDERLYKLVSSLDKGLNEVGVPDNKKYASNNVFFGNTTLCRFTSRPSQEFLNKVEEMKDILIGQLNINKISLITCNIALSSKYLKIIENYSLSE